MAIQLQDGWAAGLEAHLRDWAASEAAATAASTDRGEAQLDAGAVLEGAGRFLSSVPPGYPEATTPEEAARDWLEMVRLTRAAATASGAPGPLGSGGAGRARRDGRDPGGPRGRPGGRFAVGAPTSGRGDDFRLRRVGSELLELSSIVPVLESFGLAVVEAVPWRFNGLGREGSALYVDDIGLRVGAKAGEQGFDARASEARLVSALQAVLAGDSDQGPLNRLVIGAGLDWRQVNLLCAYLAYRDVAGGPRAASRVEAMAEGLVGYPRVAAAMVRLFSSRLCRGEVEGGPVGEPVSEDAARSALGEVPDLVHYEALQELLSMLVATTRSNWELGHDEIALKFASAGMDFLPLPRPFAEVFVWSTRFEGIHLRFGPVARGGIRWSDRQRDLRAEILDLARAQVKKNSLIIPTGAKGGYSLRAPSGPGWPGQAPGGRGGQGGQGGAGGQSWPGQALGAPGGPGGRGREAYRRFVSSLLDVTDNVVAGEVRRPDDVVCLDGDDPYLVVAADKGTASFSDIANAVSAEHGYWLGDAFASGGSHGYDHKALGITAKGAWTAVRRHFRALGMDPQRDPLRVVGVGDMSGDVFGNGMLQSTAIKLVAAFDHRHIFVDPDPAPEASFSERSRLSRLARSSWADYDLSSASKGAGTFSRQDREVELSPEARAALGAGSGPLTPPDLVKNILKAPVDLVYFGGIGTFVKASGENDVEVDDSANDEVRVLSVSLRARVVAEGANLALTQRARTGYARRGGRVNTDFVDNAAGVVMSDREVNLKILLSLAESRGLLPEGGRDPALAEAEAGAAAAVLGAVEQNIVVLDWAAATSGTDLSAYEVLMADLRAAGLLDPEVESLPGAEELARRRSAGAGLSRPELAVVLAYARSELARSIVASPLVADPCLLPLARSYLPQPLDERYGALLPDHPLFPEILASQLANEVLGRMGGLWAHEVAREYGCPLWQAAGAYWAAREVLGLGDVYRDEDEIVWELSFDAELELLSALSAATGRLARWYLSRGLPPALTEVIVRDQPLAPPVAALGGGSDRTEGLVRLGVPEHLAARAGAALDAAALGELGQAARATGRALEEVAGANQRLVEDLGLAQVADVLAGWHPNDPWDRWQWHVLTDDVADLRARASEEALAARPGRAALDAANAADAADAADEWLGPRREAVSRAAGLARELRLSPAPNLALASVALRAARSAVAAQGRQETD